MPIDFQVQRFAQLPSTNDHAKQIAALSPHGTVIVADRQTAGRGRFTRQFFSPADDGLYMSVILKEGVTTQTVGLLTCAAAVATARAIERFIPLPVHIKWVNDLLINDKKVCGILTEASLTPHGDYAFAVIGIGVNVTTAHFPKELETVASSLQKEAGTAPARAQLYTAILEELDAVLTALPARAFLAESRARSAVLGKTITVVCGNETFTAKAVDIDDNGALVVRTADGERTVYSGEVSVRL